MKFACDFCGSMQVRYKFPNPEIHSKLFNTVIKEGYFVACIDCTILLEDHEYGKLVYRSMDIPQWKEFREAIDENASHMFHQEMLFIYRKISSKREPF